MMLKNNNYMLIGVRDLKTVEDWFYYVWIFLFLPIVSMLVFSVPTYFTFKVKSMVLYILMIGVILVAEYFLYTFLASQANLINGVFNGIISIVFFYLFFFRYIGIQLKQSIE
jgi:hypothetical protein